MGRAAVIAALAASGAAALYACVEATSTRTGPGSASASSGPSSSSSAGGDGGFDKGALLESLGERVHETYVAFAAAADTLVVATQAHASSLSPADRDAARQAWRDAMSTWQRAEVMQLGPAGTAGVVAGGEDLRDEIYSWPLVNRCRVDQELVEGTYADVNAFAAKLINVRGLAALEYLMFYEGSSNACTPQATINSSGSWAAIVPELEQRRADYAVTAAILVAQEAAGLVDRWAEFRAELRTPSTTYPDDQQALNAFSNAMFYLDIETKDMKLAIPCGFSDCDADVCPEALESTYAGFAKQEVVGNLEGFQTLFLGGDALGFDDLLIGLGQGAIAERMSGEIVAALDAANAIEEDDLADALASDPESVRALYFAVKTVSDGLKTDFLSVLDLERPKSAEGDTD